MTLTRLLPTLRASIPDPLDLRVWPLGTTATTVDVAVGGVSLLHVAQVCGTPTSSSGRASDSLDSTWSVMVVRVAAVVEHSDGEPVVLVDGDPDASGAIWREARLIGRISTVRDRVSVVRPAPPYGTSRSRSFVELPRDVREGDLIAVPCSAPVPSPVAATAAALIGPGTGALRLGVRTRGA